MINCTQPDNDLSGVRFGVLLSSPLAEVWQVEAINRLVGRGAIPVVMIINRSETAPVALFSRLRNYDWPRLLFNLYYRFVFRPRSKELREVASVMPDALVMSCLPVIKGNAHYLTDDDVALIRAHHLDFILRFGFGILKGDVLLAARHGVWSFHHGDEQLYRGSPPGLWEIWRNDPVTGVILQKLTHRLDDGVVLHKGWFRTINRSWADHLDQIQNGAVDWPCRCAAAMKNETLTPVSAQSMAPLMRPPCNGVFLMMLLKIFFNRMLFHYNELFRAEDWNIAVSSDNDPFRPLDNKPLKWFPKPQRSVFAADPFLARVGDADYIWFEQYDCVSQRGRLASINVADIDQYPSKISVLLEEPWHLSYPSVVNHKGQVFCVPESFSANQIRLYRLHGEQMKLEFDSVLINNLPGVDPTLWFDGLRWWLFCTLKDAPSIHLYLFFADDLRGPYKPHPLNPVKSDLRCSRPAGPLFMTEGKLYRPSQDCAVHYGRKVVVNQVIVLSETEFIEQPAADILPNSQSRFSIGLHTFSFNKSVIVIDGKRFVFVGSVFKAKFLEHFKRLVSHV